MNISGFSFSSDDMLLVGSDYFFHNCEGYIPHDYDYIILIDKANSSYKPSFDSKDTLHIYSSHTKCDKTFYYRYEKQDFIDDIVNGIVPKYFLNKFLVPEVNEAIGFEFSEFDKSRLVLWSYKCRCKKSNSLDHLHLISLQAVFRITVIKQEHRFRIQIKYMCKLQFA